MNCPYCGRSYDGTAASCPRCRTGVVTLTTVDPQAVAIITADRAEIVDLRAQLSAVHSGACLHGWEGDARCLEDPDVPVEDYCAACALRAVAPAPVRLRCRVCGAYADELGDPCVCTLRARVRELEEASRPFAVRSHIIAFGPFGDETMARWDGRWSVVKRLRRLLGLEVEP